MYLFDSHCHLQDDRVVKSVDKIISRASAVGIKHIVCCGTSEHDWDRVLTLADRFPSVIPALGIHPWFVEGRSGRWLQKLEILVDGNPRIVIGEIGLDNALSQRNDNDQIIVFQQQLLLARRFNRPASVHCRKAWGSLMDQFRKDPDFGKKVVIHSYSGSIELIDELQQYGIYFSFSGSITYERNRRGREAVANVPLDRLLIETDSPDILPVNCTGNNEPATIIQIAQTVADLRKKSVDEIAELTYENGMRLFRD